MSAREPLKCSRKGAHSFEVLFSAGLKDYAVGLTVTIRLILGQTITMGSLLVCCSLQLSLQCMLFSMASVGCCEVAREPLSYDHNCHLPVSPAYKGLWPG